MTEPVRHKGEHYRRNRWRVVVAPSVGDDSHEKPIVRHYPSLVAVARALNFEGGAKRLDDFVRGRTRGLRTKTAHLKGLRVERIH